MTKKMKYQLLFTYRSWIPPKAEDLQKLIKIALKSLLGNVRTRELKHYGINPAQWVCPIEITSNASATVDEIEKAIRTVEGATGAQLLRARIDQSESPRLPVSRGDSAHETACEAGALVSTTLTETPAPRRDSSPRRGIKGCDKK